MGFEHLWPLLFLAFVPGIVLLYLLKQKVQTKKVPALNLWQEAFELCRHRLHGRNFVIIC